MTKIINNKRVASNLLYISRIAAFTALIIGIAVVIGWILDISSLKSLHPEFVTMKFNTALAFILSGGAILLINDNTVSKWKWKISFLFAFAVITLAFFTFIQYPLGINLGIDEIFIKDSPDALHTYSPGRMALNTSFCFILVGFALMLAFSKKYFAAQITALFLFLFSLIQILGYLFRVPEVYGFSVFTKMALHTIISFIFVSTALLFSFPEKGYLATVIDKTTGGYIARRLLPVALLLPVLLVSLRLTIEHIGVFREGEIVQIIAAVLIIIFLMLAWRFLVSIDILDKRQKEAQATAQEWYDLMNYIIQHDPSAIAVHNNELRYIFVSERYLNDHKVKEKDIIGKHHYEVFPEIPGKWRDVHRRVLAGEVLGSDDDFFIREDGSVEYTRWQCRPWRKSDETIGGIILYTEVTTERKLMELKLRKTANQLIMVLENAGDGIFAVDSEGKAVLVNRAASQMLGYGESELLGRVMHDCHHHSKNDGSPYSYEECAIHLSFKDGKSRTIRDEVFWRKDGTSFPVEYETTPIREDAVIIGAVVTFRDITLRIKAENRIIRSLYEKETLLREIFHRTNNNMLLIQSMLLLQSSGHPDMPLPVFVDIIRERIDTMSLVHKKLYESKNLSRIDLGDYLSGLSDQILERCDAADKKIVLSLDLRPIPVLFDTAVPVGLVVHELLTNSVKFAFLDKNGGELRISLADDDSGIIDLRVADNGAGFPEDFDVQSLSTTGLPMVFHLVKKQLKGTISVTNGKGIDYTIRFKDDLYQERV